MGGGGEVIWAMPERKHSFFMEVFPKDEKGFLIQAETGGQGGS